MKQRINIVIFLVMSTCLYAQQMDVKSVLEKTTDYYSNIKEYQIDMTFTMYRGITGDNITESYMGSVQKTKTCTVNTVLGVEVYQFPDVKLVVDTAKKNIIYSKSGASNGSGPIEIESLLNYYDKTKLNDGGKEWICEMVSTQKTFNQLPYGKVVLYINKKNYSVSKQVLYFSSLIPFKSKSGNEMEQDYGRLTIDLKNQPGKRETKNKLSDFIITSVDGKINVHKDYASYELINQTDYK